MALRRRSVPGGLWLVAVLAACTGSLAGQTAGVPRVWQGVYTEAQAARGRETFGAHCVRCHGTDLSGNTAPALTGERFRTSFGGEPIEKLFLKIRDTMPPQFGTSLLDDRTKLEVVTYILQRNGYPAGPADLALGSEDLVAAPLVREGEQPAVQNFALVQTVGCLARDAGGGWILQRTAEPAAARDEVPDAAALAAAADRPLGQRTFQLLSAGAFDAAAHDGHKMEVRGIVHVDGAGARLSLTSLQMIATSCAAP